MASLDAIAGIRQVPNAEIGVKGFLVGIKRSAPAYESAVRTGEAGYG